MQVFLYGGEDRYNAQLAKNKLIAKLQGQASAKDPLEVSELLATDISDFMSIPGLGGDFGLFSKKRLLVIKGLLSEGKADLREKFLDYLERRLIAKETDSDLSIMFFEPGSIDKRTKLYKLLQKQFTVQEFTEPTELEKRGYINDFIRNHKWQVSRETQEHVLNRLSKSDFLMLTNELSKLELLLKADGRTELREEDLSVLSFEVTEEIWQLFVYATTDKKKAFALLDSLLEHDQHFTQIIGFCASQLRQLIQYYYFPDKLNSYVKKRLVPLAQKIPKAKLELLLVKLYDLDIALKSGELDPRIGLQMYLSIV